MKSFTLCFVTLNQRSFQSFMCFRSYFRTLADFRYMCGRIFSFVVFVLGFLTRSEDFMPCAVDRT